MNFSKMTFKTLLVLAINILLATSNCSFKYPPIEKELFSWTLTKEQLTEIKSILENNGYNRISRDNYRYEGAYVTQYVKEIATASNVANNRVQILMSFKANDLTEGIYRNFGFRVFNLDHDDIKEINYEIEMVENIIYSKLIEFVGSRNVVRGPR